MIRIRPIRLRGLAKAFHRPCGDRLQSAKVWGGDLSPATINHTYTIGIAQRQENKLNISLDTPQRVAIVIEKTKSDTWCVGSYLVTADGRRDWRSLGVFETYADAAKALRKVWQKVSL